ncbi:MAG: DNA-binding protein [Deltaproteobacteria bacterium]|nr:DNA-binding protein [Deltaproteobacteria bacterium]
MTNPLDHFITVDQFAARYPWPSKGGLRWLIFTAEEKGITHCFIRVNRRVLIDEIAFLKWLEAHRGVPVGKSGIVRRVD